MPTVFDNNARAGLVARLEKLTPVHRPQWGKFNAQQVLVHLAGPLRAAMGEMPVAPKNGPFRFWVVKKIIIYWAPWPKGAPTAPEFIPSATGDWTRSKAEVKAALERFAANGEKGIWSEHPAFGRLTGRDWGVLQWKHFDHHLRQFGL